MAAGDKHLELAIWQSREGSVYDDVCVKATWTAAWDAAQKSLYRELDSFARKESCDTLLEFLNEMATLGKRPN